MVRKRGGKKKVLTLGILAGFSFDKLVFFLFFLTHQSQKKIQIRGILVIISHLPSLFWFSDLDQSFQIESLIGIGLTAKIELCNPFFLTHSGAFSIFSLILGPSKIKTFQLPKRNGKE